MRYAYCMPVTMSGFLKYDLLSGTCQRHEFGAGRFGGEGVFIARPGGQAEDDGWLCTFVFDQSTSLSELVLIDAREFTAPPVTRVKIPVRIPFGFHGIWLDEAALTEA
jgi:carotenoid cleavage dioxygenase